MVSDKLIQGTKALTNVRATDLSYFMLDVLGNLEDAYL